MSKRETEILKLVASEYSTNRIASELFISGKTVETHRRNLFQKLGVKNSVGLTKIAVRLGVV
ncbi:LuxR C-terminal-related transcriptional regulator [Dyadobacter sp. CY323]|nr:LuxR C-terminal-related transcriptional regulator [Dyadobacter sp. CY323]